MLELESKWKTKEWILLKQEEFPFHKKGSEIKQCSLIKQTHINFRYIEQSEMIPTGSVKYFSYSSSVYLMMSTDCTTAFKLSFNHANKTIEGVQLNQTKKVSNANHAPRQRVTWIYLVALSKRIIPSRWNTIDNSNLQCKKRET